MRDADTIRATLRRETYDLKEALAALAEKLGDIDKTAARTVCRAQSAMFETWTILCAPPEEEEDH
jgi:mevalonate pyrophosphate decarboxylase